MGGIGGGVGLPIAGKPPDDGGTNNEGGVGIGGTQRHDQCRFRVTSERILQEKRELRVSTAAHTRR